MRLCATFMVNTAKQYNWHKEIGKTCEILLSYAPTKNGVEKETFVALRCVALFFRIELNARELFLRNKRKHNKTNETQKS